jgi:hypothetical protein
LRHFSNYIRKMGAEFTRWRHYEYVEEIEQVGQPFAFTLYPGGGFRSL